MPNFHCQVVIPTRLLFEGEVAYAEVPGEMGNFGVMSGHEKIVATNRPGVATLSLDPDGKEKISFALYDGITQMVDDRLIVMGRMGCEVDSIDAEEVRRKAEDLRGVIAELEQKKDDEAVAAKLELQNDRLAWYETQLKIVGA